jgi:nitroreductase
MDIKELEQLFLNRQSCRKFSTKPVENDKLEKIIELTRLTPSACNSQPWSFEIVNNIELSQKIAAATQDMGMNKFTSNCPSFIVIVEEAATLSELVGNKFKNQEFVSNDLGLATAHIILSASVLNLSTCILGWINEKKLKELLNVDKKKRIRLVIAVGYADEKDVIREKRRKSIDKIANFHF